MPFSTYLPEHMGSIRLAPLGPFVAGSYAELTLTYTAGTFGIDDTGMVKISWRTTSDMAKPQFDDPAAPNYTTVEASNAAQLEVRFDRLNIRPWANTLLIRVGRGYLRAGDTLTVRFGDRRQGSPGFRLQTNCEERVSSSRPRSMRSPPTNSPSCRSSRASRWWRGRQRTGRRSGHRWQWSANRSASPSWPRTSGVTRRPKPRRASPLCRRGRCAGLPERVAIKTAMARGCWTISSSTPPGDLELRFMADGAELARANPLRVVAAAPLRRYWGDLHGQSGETIGMGSAESYFRYARDKAFIDIVGHQGNDFQITDAFWQELNRLTAAFDVPGRFVCVPGL